MQAALVRPPLGLRSGVGRAAGFTPWTWIGILGVLAGGLAATVASLAPARRAAVATEAEPGLQIQAAPSRPAEVEPRTEVETTARASRPESAPGATRIAKPRAAAGTPTGGNLHEEMLLIENARVALLERDPARALGELRQYEKRFPSGAFLPEATVLRIEALDQDGQHMQAVALGRRFLSANADSPLADRVERITGADAPPRR
jgi:hypothetical protein